MIIMDKVLEGENNQPSEEEIIKKIVAGEKKLYEIIIRKYNTRLYRIGMSIVNDDDEVEDIMQNAYIKAYENLIKFEGKSSFGTWLVRILINESLLQLKKKKRFVSMEDQENNKTIVSRLNGLSEKETPSTSLINKELAKALENSLSELPEKYRMVFVMREMEDMSIAETMSLLEISEANVKVRLNRAKQMLRSKLDGFYKSDQLLQFQLLRCNKMVENVLSRI